MQLVLIFSKTLTVDAGRLHSAECPVVKQREAKRRYVVIREDVDYHTADLIERGYKVRKCACCK
jgi:hypothetical protein